MSNAETSPELELGGVAPTLHAATEACQRESIAEGELIRRTRKTDGAGDQLDLAFGSNAQLAIVVVAPASDPCAVDRATVPPAHGDVGDTAESSSAGSMLPFIAPLPMVPNPQQATVCVAAARK